MPKVNRQAGIHLHSSVIKRSNGRVITATKEYYWILIARNGKTIARSSETYKRKARAVKSIKLADDLFLCHSHYYDHSTLTTKGNPEKVNY